MKEYIDLVRSQQDKFSNFEVQKVSQEDNAKVNAIARWDSSYLPMLK